MSRISDLLGSYRKMGGSIFALLIAETFIQLINAAFFLVLLIHLDKQGYPDYVAADFISYRFLGVVIVALPIGIYARGRRLLPLFYIAACLVPMLSLLILYGIYLDKAWLICSSMFLWGVFFNFITVVINPFIIRNCPKEAQSEAFALSYASNSIATILCGVLIWTFSAIPKWQLGEREIMLIIIAISLLAWPFLLRINKQENVSDDANKVKVIDRGILKNQVANYDWRLLFDALIPTLIIAIGAGFTIPFVSLFFYNVHHIDTYQFSIIGTVTAMLVTVFALLVPQTLKKLGYKRAITGTQTVAVGLLILFATTEWYAKWEWAAWLAALFFIARQPLMNMTAPMTTELILNYVGSRNRELISALSAAIWSGSWFVSSILFKLLREANQPYVNIFLITGLMYSLGVFWYYKLILTYESRVKN